MAGKLLWEILGVKHDGYFTFENKRIIYGVNRCIGVHAATTTKLYISVYLYIIYLKRFRIIYAGARIVCFFSNALAIMRHIYRYYGMHAGH